MDARWARRRHRLIVPDVLNPQQVLAVQEGLANAPFRDGRATAGAAAEQVKRNEQARGDDPGVIDLVIIEVQSGEYLGEDDIVRFEDQYGRTV